MKKLLKEHSPYLVFLCGFEILLTIVSILSFIYKDNVSIAWLSDLNLLISNLYSQTWWGLILLALGFISIFTLTSIIYKKLEYQFISTCIWVLISIIAINLNNSFGDILYTLMLYIPIIIINVIAYKQEYKKINKKK